MRNLTVRELIHILEKHEPDQIVTITGPTGDQAVTGLAATDWAGPTLEAYPIDDILRDMLPPSTSHLTGLELRLAEAIEFSLKISS